MTLVHNRKEGFIKMANSVVNQIKVGSTTYDIKPYLNSATSGDSTTANEWTAVDEAITTSDSYDTVFNKVTKMVKNVRYLYNKLGTTDFSGIGNTTSAAIVNLNDSKSDTTHTHSNYATTGHTHSEYSLTTHTHSNYSTTGHTHSNYASSTHNHDSVYAAKSHSHSEYSLTSHTHSNYSTTGHTHSNYSTTGHTHSYIATSNIVTSQTNSTTKVPAASLCYAMNQAYQTDLTNITNGKSSIATAITDKGVSTSATATFATMASNIAAIASTNTYYTSASYEWDWGYNLTFNNVNKNPDMLLVTIDMGTRTYMGWRNSLFYHSAGFGWEWCTEDYGTIYTITASNISYDSSAKTLNVRGRFTWTQSGNILYYW